MAADLGKKTRRAKPVAVADEEDDDDDDEEEKPNLGVARTKVGTIYEDGSVHSETDAFACVNRPKAGVLLCAWCGFGACLVHARCVCVVFVGGGWMGW